MLTICRVFINCWKESHKRCMRFMDFCQRTSRQLLRPYFFPKVQSNSQFEAILGIETQYRHHLFSRTLKKCILLLNYHNLQSRKWTTKCHGKEWKVYKIVFFIEQNVPLKSTTTVSVQVNDTRELFAGSNVWLKVAALDFEPSFVDELHISSLYFDFSIPEHFGSLVS